MMRNAVQILRDMQLIKSQLKDKDELRAELLKPLERELEMLGKQGTLPLEPQQGAEKGAKR